MHKIIWKIPFKNNQVPEAHVMFKIFSDWIPDSPEVFIDVADYQHIKQGPKVVLVGHYVDYALDSADDQMGLLAKFKRGLEGDLQTALLTSLKQTLATCERLQKDPLFKSEGAFDFERPLYWSNNRAADLPQAEDMQKIQLVLDTFLKTAFPTFTCHVQLNKKRNP